jgi:hypothetical protein
MILLGQGFGEYSMKAARTVISIIARHASG